MCNKYTENMYFITAKRDYSEELLPLAPLMMWMLSPAFILVCISDELFTPGITISKHNLIKWLTAYGFGH